VYYKQDKIYLEFRKNVEGEKMEKEDNDKDNDKENDKEKEKAKEREIENYQVLQQQFQFVVLQKQQLKMQAIEIDQSSKELKTATGDVYKLTGPILIKGKKEEIAKDLNENKTAIESKIDLLEKQEEKLKKSLGDLRKLIERRIASERESQSS